MNSTFSNILCRILVSIFSIQCISQLSFAQNQIGSISSFASASGETGFFSGSQGTRARITDEDGDSTSDIVTDLEGVSSLSTSASSSTPRHNSSARNSTSVFIGDGQAIVTISSSFSLDFNSISITPSASNGFASLMAARQVSGNGNGNFQLTLDAREGVWKGIYAAQVRGDTDFGSNGSLSFTHPTAQTETVDIRSAPISGLIPESPQRTSISISGGAGANSASRGAPVIGGGPSNFSFNREVDLVVILGQGELPGENLNNPLIPTLPPVFRPRLVEDTVLQHLDDINEDDPANPPSNTTGMFLVSPVKVPVVDGGYGNGQTVWIDPDLGIGYGYSLDGTNRFLTYQIPEALPQGVKHFSMGLPILSDCHSATSEMVVDWVPLLIHRG